MLLQSFTVLSYLALYTFKCLVVASQGQDVGSEQGCTHSGVSSDFQPYDNSADYSFTKTIWILLKAQSRKYSPDYIYTTSRSEIVSTSL